MTNLKNHLGALNITQKSGSESFVVDGNSLDQNLVSFWQWSSSDLVGNALRGVLAEYIVAMAIGQTGGTRQEWDAYDLRTESGIKIEVKSASYIQSWSQKDYSIIKFGIPRTWGWIAETNEYPGELKRYADVYIFCVLKTRDQDKINPLDLDQWDFYILPTSVLNDKIPDQKTITLSSLLSLKPCKTDFVGLRKVIENMGKS